MLFHYKAKSGLKSEGAGVSNLYLKLLLHTSISGSDKILVDFDVP